MKLCQTLPWSLKKILSGLTGACQNSQNNAYGDYVKANAVAAEMHYNTILGAAEHYVSSVFDKSKMEADSNISTLAGLSGSVAGAISGFLNNWIGASYNGESSYVDADRRLSHENINVAATYLTTLETITCDKQKEQNALTHYEKQISIDLWAKSHRLRDSFIVSSCQVKF